MTIQIKLHANATSLYKVNNYLSLDMLQMDLKPNKNDKNVKVKRKHKLNAESKSTYKTLLLAIKHNFWNNSLSLMPVYKSVNFA